MSGTSPFIKRDVYETLKSKMPKVSANLEAMVRMGIPKQAIMEKMREYTPVEVPDEIWTSIDWSIDCMIEDFAALN
jgi:hypothetical protein